MLLQNNKRGDVGDFVLMIVSVFIIGLMFFVGGKVWTEFKTEIVEMDEIMDNGAVNMTAEINQLDVTFNILDPMYAVFFFGFFLALLVSIFYIDSHPGFMVFGLLLFIIILFVGMIMSDVWTTIASSEQLSDEQINFPITYHLMSNLPIYLIIMGFLFFILLYATRRSSYG
jgi:hypothetical protein